MTHHYPRPPFKKGGQITDDYSSSHRARDIVPRYSDNGDVFALESGTVVDMWTGMASGEDYANTILIRSYGGMLTAYAHVDGSGKVMIGNTVKFGKKIGKVDLSGESTGRHVHLARLTAWGGEHDTIDEVLARRSEAQYFTLSLKAWP